jgi:MHS family proline/betaine transporter-like MFS transporter
MSDPERIAIPASDVFDVKRRRLIVAATIGNLLEWYDFFAFGVLAITMARLFFPTQSEVTSLLLALATYGGGLVMRPIGAIVLGLYADRVGRKDALCVAIYIMGAGTALIVVTPTYQTIGVAAPVLILIARLLQGFSGAGELGNATALLVESAPPHQRGVYASLNAAGQQIGFVLAALIVMIVSIILTPSQIEAGGWRLPFIFGLAIVPVAIYIRSKVEDSDLFINKGNEQPGISRTHMTQEGRPLLIAVGILMLYVVAGNILFVYMPTFAVQKLGLASSEALLSTVVATCVMIVCTPITAAFSDRVGRNPLLLLAGVIYVLITYPAYIIATTRPSIATLMMVQSIFGLLNAVYVGPLMAALAELFRTRLRATAVGLAFSLTVMIGALSPAFATWLIGSTDDARAPAFVVIGAAMLSVFAVILHTDKSKEPLS